jgi:dTDP-4-dehydrorhamnose 3,5-epimerase
VIFRETKLRGAYVIELEPIEDDRGFFARTFCKNEFDKYSLNPRIVQCNVSFSKTKGTLRGLHYQAKPYEEAKMVRCTRGRIYDVILDLRHDSPSFKQWVAVELTEKNRRVLYVPEGLAHGFQTLENETEVFYWMSEFYTPDYARGVRWNDPAFGINWPVGERIISTRDQSFPNFNVQKPDLR